MKSSKLPRGVNENTIMSELKKIKPLEFQTSEGIASYIEKYVKEGELIVITTSHVWLGIWKDGKATFHPKAEDPLNPDSLLNFRVFNADKELYMWRKGIKRFEGRIRIDSEGSSTEVIEVEHVLWGTKSDRLEGKWTKISEDRGTEIILPYEFSLHQKTEMNRKRRVKLITRYYIDYIESIQAGYVDSRFTKILIPKKEE